MVDTRPRAYEKARKRAAELKAQRDALQENNPVQAGKPPGSGFESERQRAKTALRDELDTFDGTGVHKIAANADRQQEDRILNVAAYCRVSTDDIEQTISIEMQKKNYREMIRSNPKWKFCGLYVDDGFSGTETAHRPGFQRMMKDALAGKIDMIITKSVSRFARNLIDCISWVRRLKEQDPPIPVLFEQENLNTLDSTSNIILFVLAMVAEEESHMKSEAMLLSLAWRFSRGRFMTPKLLGYDKIDVIENGIHRKKLVINEEQAQTVRLMYYMLLNGSSTQEIAETLTELERETGGRRKDGTPNTKWTATGIATVMRNERYCGDVLARKTWTPDFHDHKSVKNRNKKNKYYQPAHHDAIITRAQWNAAQRILNSHRYRHTGAYIPMRVIDIGALRGFISVNRSWAGHEEDEYYRVSRIAMGMEKGELRADLENEHLPDAGRRLVGMTDDNGIQRISRELSDMEKRVKAQLEGKTMEEYEQENAPPVKKGFQVVGAGMFSQAFEPVVRISSRFISFNAKCISKLNTMFEDDEGPMLRRCQYVELLFNPVERMLADSPCSPEHPNALRWANDSGNSVQLGAKAFCTQLFNMLNWDESYTFRVPAMLRSRGDEKVLFFDLDNYIGHESIVKAEAPAVVQPEIIEVEEEEDMQGFFYAADEDDGIEITEDAEEIERRVRERIEREKRTYGTPAFEHNSSTRLPMIDDDGEWDIMAEAVVLDSDHTVDAYTIEKLQDDMMEALFAPATEPDEDGDDE